MRAVEQARSLTSSYLPTSSVKATPSAFSQAGLPAANLSSMTHIVNPSAGTGTASSKPAIRRTASRTASVVAGTMRSTIALGKVTLASSQGEKLRPGADLFEELDDEERVTSPAEYHVVAGQDRDRRTAALKAPHEPARDEPHGGLRTASRNRRGRPGRSGRALPCGSRGGTRSQRPST